LSPGRNRQKGNCRKPIEQGPSGNFFHGRCPQEFCGNANIPLHVNQS